MGKSQRDGEEYITYTPEETQSLGFKIAEKISVEKNLPKIFALIGNLGSGKTTFAKGFFKFFGIKKISSPSFVIVNCYKENIYHIDFFRLESEEELWNIGLEEILFNSENIILIEWAEKFIEVLPEKRWEIYFHILNKNIRKIKILVK